MLSIVSTKEEHQTFTHAWRKKFPYSDTKLIPKGVENFARELYKN